MPVNRLAVALLVQARLTSEGSRRCLATVAAEQGHLRPWLVTPVLKTHGLGNVELRR
jgi:hypothetical protein